MTESTMTPAAALTELMSGNLRFVEDRPAHPNQDSHRRTSGAAGQTPFALIFGCSDSRVAAEIIFDRGLGDVFVVRTAGHIVDNGVLGSIEFGADVLNIPLIIVLGHDGCGAVRATMEAYSSGRIPSGAVRHVVELVTPSLLTAATSGLPTVDQTVAEHARQTMYQLPERSAAIARRIADGRCAVVAMEYTLAEGRVRILDHLGEAGLDAPA